MADKISLGLVTGASGIGGASGYHYASLQRKEAKKEETSKAWDENDARRAKVLGQRHHEAAIAAGRFIKYGDDPDHVPAVPQRHLKLVSRSVAPPRRSEKSYGGIDPEDRRQRRMKGEQWGAAGVSGAAATALVGQQARNAASRRLVPKLEAKAKRKEGNAARAQKRTGTYRGQATLAGNRQKKYLAAGDDTKLIRAVQQMGRHTRRADAAAKVANQSMKSAGRARMGIRLLGTPSSKGAAALGATALLAGAGAAGMSRMRRGQGRYYSDWWDG